MRATVERQLYPSFFGPVGQPRQTYVGRYLQSTSVLPRVVFASTHTGCASGFIRLAEDWSELLFEKDRPIALRTRNVLHLRNLAQVTFRITASNGTLDLNPYFPVDPPIEDTLFVVIDKWRRRFYIDPGDRRYYSGYIDLGLDGTFDVSWLSKSLHNQILAGTSYILVDGRRTDVVTNDVPNSWDEYALRLGATRQPGQTNVSLKKVCQHLTVSDRPEVRLSALLGTSISQYWPAVASGSLDLTSYGAVSATVQGIPRRQVVRESPIREGSNLHTTKIPQGDRKSTRLNSSHRT